VAVLICYVQKLHLIILKQVQFPLKKMFLGLGKICNLRFLILINPIYNSRIDEMEAVIMELKKKMEIKD